MADTKKKAEKKTTEVAETLRTIKRREAMLSVSRMLASASKSSAALGERFDKGAGLFPTRK